MEAVFLEEPIAVEPIDALLLDADGFVEPLPAKELACIPPLHLTQWCQTRGRYNVPSVELVAWLMEQIAGRRAIEIGAGMGDLGRQLGIPMTDSYVQVRDPQIRQQIENLGMPILSPPEGVVECLNARKAVLKYKPKVVIAAWVTQRYLQGDEGPPKVNSFVYGVNEIELLSSVDTYIHIGNLSVHGDKRILRRPHREYFLPFLFSRGFHPDENVVHVWNRK